MIPLPENWSAIASERVKQAKALKWETEQQGDLWLAWSPEYTHCGSGDSEFMALWDLVADPAIWDEIGEMLGVAS
jgi:hypothetical protein